MDLSQDGRDGVGSWAGEGPDLVGPLVKFPEQHVFVGG